MDSGESIETTAGRSVTTREIISSSLEIIAVSARSPRSTHHPEGRASEPVRSIPITVECSAGVPSKAFVNVGIVRDRPRLRRPGSSGSGCVSSAYPCGENLGSENKRSGCTSNRLSISSNIPHIPTTSWRLYATKRGKACASPRRYRCHRSTASLPCIPSNPPRAGSPISPSINF